MFLIVTLDNCPPFMEKFKCVYDRLLNLYPDFSFRYIHLNNTSRLVELPDNIPQCLNKWIRWYPTLIIFDGESWDNNDPTLKGDIFNGTFDDTSGYVKFSNIIVPNEDSISDWIYHTLCKYMPINIMKRNLLKKKYQEELLQVYHKFTLSPT